MKNLKNIVLQIAVLSLTVILAACSSGGSSHSSAPVTETTAPETVTGSVVQGPVANALVFADRSNESGEYNYKLDDDESYTRTADDGTFNDLVIPAGYGDYVLVSKGGTDTISGDPAISMRAPKGAKNITPITTLVASVPAGAERDSLVAKLATMAGDGGAYDDDPASESGTSEQFFALTKMVEKVVMLMGDLGISDDNDQASVVSAIANGIKDADASADLSDTVAAAASTSIKSIEGGDFAVVEGRETDFDTFLNDFVANVEDTVTAASVDGKVVENSELVTSIDENVDVVFNGAELENIVTTVTAEIDELILQDANGFDLANTDIDENPTVTAGDASYLVAILEAFNNTGAAVEKTGVVLTLEILDNNTQRSAVFTISNAVVTIGQNVITTDDPSGEAEVNVNLDNAELNVIATNMDGSSVSTEPVSGPFEVFAVVDNEVKLDLVKVQDLFTDQVAEDFGTIALKGDYSISFSASGAPILPEAMLLTVE